MKEKDNKKKNKKSVEDEVIEEEYKLGEEYYNKLLDEAKKQNNDYE